MGRASRIRRTDVSVLRFFSSSFLEALNVTHITCMAAVMGCKHCYFFPYMHGLSLYQQKAATQASVVMKR